jgi:hypothetical protein
MEETPAQKSFFNLVQLSIYLYISIDIYTQCLSYRYQNVIALRLNSVLYKIPVLNNAVYSHVTVFLIVLVLAGLTQSRKDLKFDLHRHFTYSFVFGSLLYISSVFLLKITDPTARLVAYSVSYFVGAVLLHVAISNLSKKIFANIKEDIWNVEQESFPQNQSLVVTDHSFNLPIHFYHNRKVHKGWMNINPFRAAMVIGVPGSGKSESVIIPFIKQMLSKGFSMLVYDFKFPDLGKMTYYHYMMHHVNDGVLKEHAFHVINLDNVELSRRCNPLHARYIRSLGDATETAEAIISALLKTDKSSGSSQFFTQSAINFLAAVIYYLARFEKGKYSTLPHVIAFISGNYERIFNTLFSNIELQTILAPFKSAFENKAFDQLEGQIGTVRINISRIATKEAFWVFGAEDFDLKISNPPSVLVLANSPDTQSMNSAFYSAVLMRVVRLINTKNNHPSALVIDETPTLFLHKIENLIATARSNRVAVMLGLQEIPQFYLQYGKEVANSITSIMGTVISGAVRNKETLDWLEKLFGKVKQTTTGVSIDRSRTNVSINEKMDSLIPASKIANQNAGELVGLVSRENDTTYGMYQPNMFACKADINFPAIEKEKKEYRDLPNFYTFGTQEEKEAFLLHNLQKIFTEIETILL